MGWGCWSASHCWVVCFAHAVHLCVCVCGVLFMEKLHCSVIWLMYGPQLPHKNRGRNLFKFTVTQIQTPACMDTHTINNAGNAIELAARLNWVYKVGIYTASCLHTEI